MSAALVLAGCGGTREKVPAIDLSNLDTTVSPKVDFYQYSTGGWQKKHPLGAEYARFGTFDQLRETNVERLNGLFKEMTGLSTEDGSDEQKISDLYKMGLDSVRLNAEGAEPVKRYLDAIYAVSDKEGLVKLIATMHDAGSNLFFGASVSADLDDSDSQILYMGQGGLGIGNRDYYVKEENASVKEAYRTFLAAVFSLSGADDPQHAADNALSVEDVLARYSWTNVQERDIDAQNNPRTTAEIIKSYPGFDFGLYFSQRNIPEQKKIIVAELSYFEGMSEFFGTADLDALKDYVAGQFLQESCPYLSDDFYNAYFDFFSRAMSGVTQQKPRWKRAMAVPNSILGEAVGKMYVARYFPEAYKSQMLELVKNLQTALSQHIDNLDWMSDVTKEKAHEKLDNFTVKIGYPDKWKDYGTLRIDSQKSYLENILEASRWYVADNMSKLGKKTDRSEWGMTPQTVNAYYNPSTNEICFPAAILQPPFFNPDADDPVNYGAIGVVIGHEMSHGFDDQGRLFDAKGNKTDWWTKEDAEKFKAKADILADQYSRVEVLPGVMADGRNTLGENIGDHGGLSIAYTAMENAMQGKTAAPIDGFTPSQRFYLAYATVWAQNITDEEKKRLTLLDVHSLACNRVNVALKNFQTFFDAFGITEGDPMFLPEGQRVHIW